MSRFYYYLLFINMVVNIVACVPSILVHFAKKGAVSALPLAAVAGLLFIFFLTKFFNAFPGKGLPELLSQVTPKWFNRIFLFFLAVAWFIAGLTTLITFTFILVRYLTPELSISLIVVNFLFFIMFGMFMKGNRILYGAEIILILTLPLILFIIFKAYSNPYFEWTFVQYSMTYINQAPQFGAFSASVFIFAGAANLIIFNRFFVEHQTFGWKQMFAVSMMGLPVLFTTFFVPIGLNGFDHIDSLIYPWIQTSDSLRMRYGIIERVLFVFLLFFLALSYIGIVIHWYVSVELLKSIFNFDKFKIKKIKVYDLLTIIIFSLISYISTTTLNEYQLFLFSDYYYRGLMGMFVFFVGLLWFIKRRLKHAENKNTH